VADAVCPAAVIEVGTADGALWDCAVGRLSLAENSPAATRDTVFDLASLTKVIATTTIAMRLVECARLDLAAPVHAYLDQWRAPDRRAVTIADLLGHCAGLPEWAPLFATCANRAHVLSALVAHPLEYAPGTAARYSDLGFILLGFVLEAVAQSPLDQLWTDVLATFPGEGVPIELAFGASEAWLPRLAPTRVRTRRGLQTAGSVDDENACAMGGAAGHAGMFGTAAGVGRFAAEMLRALTGTAPATTRLMSVETAHRMLSPSTVSGSSRALGWDLMRPTSSCGANLSSRAFGHTGFTGTSLWIDPERGFYVVLLTNRVHPEAGSSEPIQHLRRTVHDAVACALA
jgi:CubicO group peptidase (beta-lactamase class C family)